MTDKYTIILGRDFGFFSLFMHIVQQIYHAEVEGRIPIVYWTGGIYFQKSLCYNDVKSKNIWDYFFEPVSDARVKDVFPWLLEQNHIDRKSVPPEKIPSNVKLVSELDSPVRGEPLHCFRDGYTRGKVSLNNMNMECRSFVNSIINKYVKIRPIVLEKIESFYKTHFEGSHVLGIHIRGCQPVGLGDNIVYQFIVRIRQYIEKHPECKIFIATDSNICRKQIKKQYIDRVCFCDAFRAQQEGSLFDIPKKHLHKRMNKYRKLGEDKQIIGAKPAEEALIDCILLSKSDFFYRSYSNLSAAVSCFNPNLPTALAITHSPEQKEIIKVQDE